MKQKNQGKILILIILLFLQTITISTPVSADIQIRIIQGALYINNNPDTYMITEGIEIHLQVSDGQEKTISTKEYASGLNFGTGFSNIELGENVTFTINLNGSLPPEKIRIDNIEYHQDYITITTEEIYTVDLFINISNSPPNIPQLKTPEDGSIDITITPKFNWTCSDPENETLTYDIFIGKNQPIHTNDVKKRNHTTTTFTSKRLEYDTWYYWKIIATDEHENKEESQEWSFRTIENLPPNKPKDPQPSHNSKNQSKNQQLHWNAEDPYQDNLTYDVYFGTNQSLTNNDKQSNNQTTNNYNPGIILTYNQTYYWKIIAYDQDGLSNSSRTWKFTVSETNLGPRNPRNPNPSHEEENVNMTQSLTWDGGDQDGDNITYDLYFGTDSNPPLVKENMVNTTYDPTNLVVDTNYYWKIVATDELEATITGPIWSFTTASSSTLGFPTAHAGGPYTGSPNENINFDASKSTDNNGITGYRWDFTNDGTYDTEWSTNPTTTHAYPSTFNGNVKLIVKDANGNTDTATAKVTIESSNSPPYDLIIEGPTSGIINESYTINISAVDDDGGQLIFTIDWDDGSSPTTITSSSNTQEFASHTYTTTNLYEINVVVKDDKNAEDEALKIIAIKENEATTNDNNDKEESGFPLFILIIILIIVAAVIIFFFLYKQGKITFINISSPSNSQQSSNRSLKSMLKTPFQRRSKTLPQHNQIDQFNQNFSDDSSSSMSDPITNNNNRDQDVEFQSFPTTSINDESDRETLTEDEEETEEGEFKRL